MFNVYASTSKCVGFGVSTVVSFATFKDVRHGTVEFHCGMIWLANNVHDRKPPDRSVSGEPGGGAVATPGARLKFVSEPPP